VKRIAVFGAGGHGRVVASIARDAGYDDILFIDDDASLAHAIPWERFLSRTPMPVALGIGDNAARKKVYKKCCEANIEVVSLVHSSAVIADDVHLGEGTVVMPRVTVNTGTSVGEGCILNTGCIVEHDNRIGSFVHIAPGAVCAGNVRLEEGVHFGLSSCAVQQTTVGAYAFVGAGSVVVNDIPPRTLAYGIPCKPRKEHDA